MKMEGIYRRLSKVYEFPESKYLPKILEMCLTDQEALVLLSLPGTVEEVTKKLRVEVPSVQSILSGLFNKGFIVYDLMEGKRKYALISLPMDAIMVSKWSDQFGKEFFDLWNCMYDEEISHHFDEEGQEARVIPIEKTIESETEFLPYEKVSEILREAETIAVMRCPCRTRSRRCNNPLETCIGLNETAKYALERGVARELTREEALSILNMCEELGLVHEVDHASHGGGWICNCCTCCCAYLRAQTILGRKNASVKSRYRAVVDLELCKSCSLCVERCNFGAIKMVNSKPMLPVVDEEKCFGCGLCASKCPTNAIRLIQVRGPEHIPVRKAEPLSSSL
jgi:NAD-dependent dihydropyrimidine dehydrogenase PreA subunit